MKALRLAVALVGLAVVSGSTRAESPRYGSFELGAGTYRPNIDAQTGLQAPLPYQDIFGSGRGWMFRVGISRALFTYPGALELGFRTGYYRASGSSRQVDPLTGAITDQKSTDTTTFNIVPTSLTLTYRFDLLADRYNVPFAPYGRVALERYNWWASAEGSSTKTGATNGYSFTGGIAFLLDFLDAGLGRELDADTGINHTYLFFDVTKSWVKDFGSSKSWDLSDGKASLAFGMMFVF
ncbi:MAG TPA: MXAN_2562 family outer membrane beta-barrel protein [Anaeromyxobacter sp.]